MIKWEMNQRPNEFVLLFRLLDCILSKKYFVLQLNFFINM